MPIETMVECDRCRGEIFAGYDFYAAQVTNYSLTFDQLMNRKDRKLAVICPECWEEINAVWEKGKVE